MMNKETIQQIWNSLYHTGKGEFEYRLIPNQEFHYLNLGLNSNGERCLILDLDKLDFDQKHIEKENISLKYFKTENCLCIILNNSMFYEIFDDLVLSINNKISQSSNLQFAATTFVKHFNKWSAFFEKKYSKRMSETSILGLFGELKFLEALMSSEDTSIDELLMGWRGPYDEAHDFVYDLFDYEIKTIKKDSGFVKISSEFQLESTVGKELSLVIQFTEDNLQIGQNLSELYKVIFEMILERSGDLSIFLDALSQKGLNKDELKLYDERKYTILSKSIYHPLMDGFPKLISANLPLGVSNLNYTLNLKTIENFKVN